MAHGQAAKRTLEGAGSPLKRFEPHKSLVEPPQQGQLHQPARTGLEHAGQQHPNEEELPVMAITCGGEHRWLLN